MFPQKNKSKFLVKIKVKSLSWLPINKVRIKEQELVEFIFNIQRIQVDSNLHKIMIWSIQLPCLVAGIRAPYFLNLSIGALQRTQFKTSLYQFLNVMESTWSKVDKDSEDTKRIQPNHSWKAQANWNLQKKNIRNERAFAKRYTYLMLVVIRVKVSMQLETWPGIMFTQVPIRNIR